MRGDFKIQHKVVLVQCTLLAVAFAFELIAVLTVPVTKSLSLCTYNGFKFGVFGICDADGSCTKVSVGYTSEGLDNLSGFSLPSNARQSISKLLIVHVLAAAFTLLMFLLNLLTLMSRFATSTGFLLVLLLGTVPTFLLALLSFLVDILLFIPHLDWCGWTVLASAVLIVISGTTTCVTRRTVSSRKSHLRHIHGGDGDLYSLVGSETSSTGSNLEVQESKQYENNDEHNDVGVVYGTPQRQTSTGFSFTRARNSSYGYAPLEQNSPHLMQRAAVRHQDPDGSSLHPYTPVHNLPDGDVLSHPVAALDPVAANAWDFGSPRRRGEELPQNNTFDELYGQAYSDSENGKEDEVVSQAETGLSHPIANPYLSETPARMPTVDLRNNRASLLEGPEEEREEQPEEQHSHSVTPASSIYVPISRAPNFKNTHTSKPVGPRPLPSDVRSGDEARHPEFATDAPVLAPPASFGESKSLQAPSSYYLSEQENLESDLDFKFDSNQSLVESNFTSISQRPINPKYYEIERLSNQGNKADSSLVSQRNPHIYNQRVPTPYRQQQAQPTLSPHLEDGYVFDNSKIAGRRVHDKSNNTSKEF
ncbi:unnamed protein product [Kuraishia capsulata CBS 1993]|uniref:PH-response regulator protein palI/RIM9 n=1 Tax=Kuraishia capsulata CBS 1993 TaxID=1382522 RepID=W6MMR6_9ASCO|nr:uncharacterized protein KUCA_T00003884001 [Kuraishia capsulata CBS 1993]CDK27904.1 unnamed protein product [Kuraishia capsulata CBS 1993]